MDGILLIDKPEGATSADVVRDVKRTIRCKVGHLGTLDPFASGLLPLCLGEGTKIAQFLNAAYKVYTGVIRFGSRTDTGDRTGSVVEEKTLPSTLTADRCSAVAASLIGDRLQTPPMYSAVKKEGVPLYKLARRGIEVERQAREVTVHSLELHPLDEQRATVRLHCSKGTYVRVLAEEIGQAFGTVAHLESLRRTGFGHFRIEAAIGLPISAEVASAAVIDPRQALDDLPEVDVDAATADLVGHGRVAVLARFERPASREAALKIIGPDGRLLAVLTADPAGRWQFARVLS